MTTRRRARDMILPRALAGPAPVQRRHGHRQRDISVAYRSSLEHGRALKDKQDRTTEQHTFASMDHNRRSIINAAPTIIADGHAGGPSLISASTSSGIPLGASSVGASGSGSGDAAEIGSTFFERERERLIEEISGVGRILPFVASVSSGVLIRFPGVIGRVTICRASRSSCRQQTC